MEFLGSNSFTSTRCLSFIAEWYQEEAGMIRSFHITFYPNDQSLEVFEQKTKKTFLRRTKMPEITEKDFFIGSKINVFGRQFDIVDYGDETTKNCLAKFRTKGFMLLKHSIIPYLGKILSLLVESDISIIEGAMVNFSPEAAHRLTENENEQNERITTLMDDLLAGPSIGFALVADNIVTKLKDCQNQTKESFNTDVPSALRQLFEEESFRKGIYCSQSESDVNKDTSFFFIKKLGLTLTSTCQNTTLAVIKPHAIKDGNLGKIISEITLRGFKINALKMQQMERENCEEFYEVYRGIIPEYIQMVAQLASGVCMALEITSKNDSINTHKEFREFCGPNDPEVAKLLRPNSLRAKFGVTKVKNAIHCTDLEEDAVLEVQYFFKILADT